MEYNHSSIKQNAKAHLSAFYWKCVVVSLIFIIFCGGGGSGSSSVSFPDLDSSSYSGSSSYYGTESQYYGTDSSESAAAVAIIGLVTIAVIIGLAIGLVVSAFFCNMIKVGHDGWYYRSVAGLNPDIGTFFSIGFKNNYMNKVKVMFVKDIYVFLWSLLFIVPGIIKQYEYRFVSYVLSENPNLSVSDAIGISREMTRGYKGKLFYLDLSFIGWNILSVFTCGILSIFYVNPYYDSACALAYYQLKNVAISNGAVNPNVLGTVASINY